MGLSSRSEKPSIVPSPKSRMLGFSFFILCLFPFCWLFFSNSLNISLSSRNRFVSFLLQCCFSNSNSRYNISNRNEQYLSDNVTHFRRQFSPWLSVIIRAFKIQDSVIFPFNASTSGVHYEKDLSEVANIYPLSRYCVPWMLLFLVAINSVHKGKGRKL